MIVETSALICVLTEEPEAELYIRCMVSAIEPLTMSTGSFLETSNVLERKGNQNAVAELDIFIARAKILLLPFTESQARIARDCFRQFGKGSCHPAQLNFGDCFALALSLETGEPLLYKGDDFRWAGVRNALDDFIAR